eukprot:7327540-Heterocapsa_arctica.AAC.1
MAERTLPPMKRSSIVAKGRRHVALSFRYNRTPPARESRCYAHEPGKRGNTCNESEKLLGPCDITLHGRRPRLSP